MDWPQLLTLATLQGVTEFLPISSSGHLVIISPLMSWQDQGLNFDISLHVGTLIAVIFYCRQFVIEMALGLIQTLKTRKMVAGSWMMLWLVLATLPIIIVGFFVKDYVDFFLRNIWLIGTTTLGFGILLGFVDHYARQDANLEQLNHKKALWVGFCQVLAIIPGVSRSGITITAARSLGMDRKSAAKFSFLLSIPTITGAGTLMMVEVTNNPTYSELPLTTMGLAALISGLVAYAVMYYLMRWLERAGFMPFVLYRIGLGIILMVYAYSL